MALGHTDPLGRLPPVRRALALCALLALSGCHLIRYDTGRQAGPRHVDITVHFFFWGLKGGEVVDLDDACPEGVARWESRATFGNWLVDVLTLGVYGPRTVHIECEAVAR